LPVRGDVFNAVISYLSTHLSLDFSKAGEIGGSWQLERKVINRNIYKKKNKTHAAGRLKAGKPVDFASGQRKIL